MKEKLQQLISAKYGEISTMPIERQTQVFLEVYRMVSETFDRDFEHAWQIVIKSKKDAS